MSSSREVDVTQKLGGVKLTPLGPDGRISGEAVPLGSLWKEGLVVFAVRRPGWPLCREEAVDLCAALKDAGLTVPVVAVVKEQELAPPVRDEAKMLGLADFRDKYFCGPLYLSDSARTLYEFLGDKSIFSIGDIGRALLNPFKASQSFKGMGERFERKGIEGNMVGDGLTKGGVLCIGPDGVLQHAFYEDPGKGIPPEDQAKIVEAARSFGTR